MSHITGVIIIGRNEGERLRRCLASAKNYGPIVYVDSGSTDGSLEVARAYGALTVELDLSKPFTAARARNAGFRELIAADTSISFVQFVDGDCELHPEWRRQALEAFGVHPRAAIICGRRRERYPAASVYNQLCDIEWDTPVGAAAACGGDALISVAAFRDVGGFNPDLIAGEEPEMCLRLRIAGWEVWRVPHEMTLHDAAMFRFDQWWQRNVRAGYAYAQGASLHGSAPHFHYRREVYSNWLWGLVVPLSGVLTLGFAWVLWLIQGMRIYRRSRVRLGSRLAGYHTLFLLLGKSPKSKVKLDSK